MLQSAEIVRRPGALDQLEQTQAGRGVGQVAGLDFDSHAVVALQLGRQLVQAILAPGDEREVVATGRQLAGELDADPGRGSCHDGGCVGGRRG